MISGSSRQQQNGPTIEVPVVVYPLRGWLNPYWIYLVPLIIIAIMAMLLSIGAFVSDLCVIKDWDVFWTNTPGTYETAWILALIVYPLCAILSGVLAGVYILNVFNFLDSKFTPFALDFLTCVIIAFLIPISILLIVAESVLTTTEGILDVFVTRWALMTEGILGMIATGFLINGLFLSRIYQMCIGIYKFKKTEVLQAAQLAAELDKTGVV